MTLLSVNGYKGYCIKEYFANCALHSSDVTFDFSRNSSEIHKYTAEPWRVTLVDTGLSTMTGGRLLRIREYLDDNDFASHMVMVFLILIYLS